MGRLGRMWRVSSFELAVLSSQSRLKFLGCDARDIGVLYLPG